MSVLLAFNEADSWTVAKLAEATQIKMDILIQVRLSFRHFIFQKWILTLESSLKVLQILLKSKLLVGPNVEAMDEDGSGIAPDAVVCIRIWASNFLNLFTR